MVLVLELVPAAGRARPSRTTSRRYVKTLAPSQSQTSEEKCVVDCTPYLADQRIRRLAKTCLLCRQQGIGGEGVA